MSRDPEQTRLLGSALLLLAASCAIGAIIGCILAATIVGPAIDQLIASFTDLP